MHIRLFATLAFGLALAAAPSLPAADRDAPKDRDEIEKAIIEAYELYGKDDEQAALARLREVVKQLEGRNALRLEAALPATIGDWGGLELKNEDLSFVGGGLSLARTYKKGEREITVKIIRGSPLLEPAIAYLSNTDLIRASRAKTHRIGGELAVIDENRKLQMLIGEKTYFAAECNKFASETDVISLTRKIDIAAIKKAK